MYIYNIDSTTSILGLPEMKKTSLNSCPYTTCCSLFHVICSQVLPVSSKRGEEISRGKIVLDANLLCYCVKVKSDLILFLFCVWIIDLCNMPYSPLLALLMVPHYHLVSKISSPQSLNLHAYHAVTNVWYLLFFNLVSTSPSTTTESSGKRAWERG